MTGTLGSHGSRRDPRQHDRSVRVNQGQADRGRRHTRDQGDDQSKQSSSTRRQAAPVTVVIPARDEASTIGPLLDSLLAQTRPPEEILVVDAGSTDSTAETVRRYARRGVSLLEIGPAFPGRARNRGIAQARHDWIALIDAGCVAHPQWLAALDAGRSALPSRMGVVWGCYEPLVETAWDEAQALVIGPIRRRLHGQTAPFVASSLIHRDMWRRVGGFREDLRAAEDLIFFDALRDMLTAEKFAPTATVSWELGQSVGAFFRRLRVYSRHHARARLWRTWHARVGLMDAAGVVLGAIALRWPSAWLVLGLAVSLRLGRTIGQRRGNITRSPWRVGCLVRVGVLVALADLAMWMGVVDLVYRWIAREDAGAA